jgi:hypothetical protein
METEYRISHPPAAETAEVSNFSAIFCFDILAASGEFCGSD